MTSRAVARRYAAALFDVTEPRGHADQALPVLETFRDLLAGHDELQSVFGNPSVQADQKRAIVEALYEKTGGGSDEVKRLLLLLADRNRLALVSDIAAIMKERLQAARHTMPADVVTAVALDDREHAALTSALSAASGSTVTINARVDPSILGGVIARVGDRVFDGSLTFQLARMKQRLLAE
jgi:F-type H+-transporting ATPase subunit delta